MTERLWEPEHDFYGPEASYWGRGTDQAPYINRFDSWAEFIDGGAMSNAPLGLNFLYRWDWHAWHIEYPEDYPDGKEEFVLEFFWLMPRKGIMARSSIRVTPADEDAVRVWLEPHARYMQELWSPILPLAVREGAA